MQTVSCSFGFSSGGGGGGGGTISGGGTVPRMPKFTSPTSIGDSQMADNGTTVFIGASATSTSAMFEVNSTTQGVLFPRMTTVQRDAVTVGATEDSLLIYNISAQEYQYYDDVASAWVTVGGENIYTVNGNLTENRIFDLDSNDLTIQDGFGGSNFLVSVDTVNIVANAGTVELNGTAGVLLNQTTVIGSGSTSATFTATFENLAGDLSLQVRDDGSVYNHGAGVVSTNTAFGLGALISNTTGTTNVAIGVSALENNTDGRESVAIGYQALQANIGGFANTAIGYRANYLNTTGDNNVAIGYASLDANVTGGDNTAIGRNSLGTSTGGSNVGIGSGAGSALVGGAENTFVGKNSGSGQKSGNSNVYLGFAGIGGNSTGSGNIGIGTTIWQGSIRTGATNVAIGSSIGGAFTSAANNVLIGKGIGGGITTGAGNVILGLSAANSSNISNSVVIGTFAANSNTGDPIIAIGNQALGGNTTATGSDNVTIGAFSSHQAVTASHNVAMGNESLQLNLFGNRNSTYGHQSGENFGFNALTGDFIIGVSYTITVTGDTDFTLIGAANSNVGTVFTATGVGGGTTGRAAANSHDNTALGYRAGASNVAASTSVYIGSDTKALADGGANEIVIGYNATGNGSNTVTLGNTSIVTTVLQGNVGIGVTAPLAKLHVEGAGSTSATYTAQFHNSSGSSNTLLIRDDGNIGNGRLAVAGAKFYQLATGQSYGFTSFDATAASYRAFDGSSLGAFYCDRLVQLGVNIVGNNAATSGRTAGVFHVYGTNTSSNTALSLRAENGASNLAINVISGSQIFQSGELYTAVSIATQKGSDGKLSFNSNLWNGATADNTTFDIQSIASITVGEETRLGLSYEGLEIMTLRNDGNIGIGTAAPTALLQIAAGTATASTAPLKFTTGVLNTAAETGAMEFASDFFYLTANAVRTAISTFGRSVASAATYTVLITDRIVGVTRTATGASTINLPSAALYPDGYQLTIMDEGLNATTNNITIDASASQTINGNLTEVINTDGDSRTLYSNGVDAWFIM